jgi:hypothetical protein
VPTALPRHKATAADLIALALEHRIQAERSTCPAEQRELHRVADIYTALATLDLPMSTFAKDECLAQADSCQSAEAIVLARSGSRP